MVSTENMPCADWLEYRKQGIGGSDASMVCGINRCKSPVELWMEKTNQLQAQEAGEAAYWGTQLEPFVRSEFTKRTGIEVTRRSELLQSEEHPFMLANLDSICEVPDVGTCIFEAKTASACKAGEWEDTIPDEYMLQLAHYMAVTGYAGAYIAVLIGGNTFRWKFVERDEELISMLIEMESAFWNHVQDGTPRRWMAPMLLPSSLLNASVTASLSPTSPCLTPPLICWLSTMKPVKNWKLSPSGSRRPRIF